MKIAFPTLKKLFADIGCLRKPAGVNAMTQDLSFASIDAVWLFIAGFVCKDISNLNPLAQQFGNCVENTEGRTGGTYKGVVGYATAHQPQNLLLENVSAIKGDSLTNCLRQLSEVGYSAVAVELSPEYFAIPQSRNRVYIIASLGAASRCTLVKVAAAIKEYYMSSIFPRDAFLLNENDPIVEAEYQSLLNSKQKKDGGKSDGKTKKTPTWVDNRDEPSQKKQRKRMGNDKWADPMVAATNQWLDLLTPRERDIMKGVETGVVDVSQSASFATPNTRGPVPCVTPGAKFWDADRERLLTGVEKAVFQGIIHKRDVYEQFDKDFWHDLAGNSFCSPVVTLIILSWLSVLAQEEISDDDVMKAEEVAMEAADSKLYDEDCDLLAEVAKEGAELLMEEDMAHLLEEAVEPAEKTLVDAV